MMHLENFSLTGFLSVNRIILPLVTDFLSVSGTLLASLTDFFSVSGTFFHALTDKKSVKDEKNWPEIVEAAHC